MGSWYTKNESGKTLLVFEEQDELKEFDNVTLSMIRNNSIACMIPCSVSQMDDSRFIKFNITSRIAFTEFLERPTTFDIVSDLFINMSRSFLELRKYMITTSSLHLDVNWMYIDMSSRMAEFIAIPTVDEQNDIDVKRFFQDIVIDLDMGADSRYMGLILNLLKEKNFSLEGFIEGLERLRNSGAPAAANVNVPQAAAVQGGYQNVRTYPQAAAPAAAPAVNIPAQNPMAGTFQNQAPQVNIPPAVGKVNAAGAANMGAVNLGAAKLGNDKADKAGISNILGGLFGKKKGKAEAPKKVAVPQKTPAAPANPGFAIPGRENDFAAANVPVPQNIPAQQNIPVQQNVPTPAAAPQKVQVSKNITSNAQPAEPQQVPPVFDAGEGYVAPAAKLDADRETTQMMGEYTEENAPRLIRNKTHEIIEIEKDTFNLGKDPKELLDYVINDKRVSRRHASIICKDSSYFVVDRGSTNHTFLNGKQLVPNQEYPLHSGDSIRFGPEEFTFDL